MNQLISKEWFFEYKKQGYNFVFKLIDLVPYFGLLIFSNRNKKRGLMPNGGFPVWLFLIHLIVVLIMSGIATYFLL